MFNHGLLYKVQMEKRKRERMKAAHYMAVGMGVIIVAGIGVATGILFKTKYGREMREKMKDKAIDTVENVKNIVIRSADAVEASAAHTAEKVSNVIEASENKADAIKKELRNSSREIIKDVQETAENISKTIKEE